MPQDVTPANAQGNASALVYATTTDMPAELRFEEYLTPEQLGRHFESNEEVLELAELIDREEEAIATIYSNDFYRVSGSATDDRDGLLIPLAEAHIHRHRQEIARLEGEIINEVIEVQGEFAMLARNLTENRRNTINLQARLDRELANPDLGFTADEVDIYAPGVRRGLEQYHEQFEQYAESYEGIKQGFAFQSSSEMWRNFMIGFGEIIALEVATLGAAKFFRVAQAANRIRNAVVASSYYAAMAARFAALSAATKARLARLRRTRQPERPPVRSETGPASQETPSANATPRGACALC